MHARRLGSLGSIATPLVTLAAVMTTSAFARASEPVAEVSSGFQLGASLDYQTSYDLVAGGSPEGAGPAVGGHVGYRWRYLYFGGVYAHAFLKGGSQGHDGEVFQSNGASSDYGGLDFDCIATPDAPVSFVAHFTAGYRAESNTSPGAPTTYNPGPLVGTGIGFQIHPTSWLRLQPEVVGAIGQGGLYASAGVTVFFDAGSP